MKRSAFTMIELVMVIVVLGILAALSMPRLDRDIRQEAADSILSDIRYTQFLALMDNKHNFNNPEWQQRFWRITFSNCGTDQFYMIGSDESMDGSNSANFALTEAAIDPTNNQPMFYACSGVNKTSVSDRIFITDKYGITTVTPSGGCTTAVNGSGGKHLAFDQFGRPHYGFSTSTTPNYASYMKETCTLTFTMSSGDTFAITILPETGHTYIVGQPDS